jgi:hypothetical protein
VDVLDACNNLLENSDGGLLMKTLVLHDVIKQLPVGAVLHDEVELRLGFDNQQLAQGLPRTAGSRWGAGPFSKFLFPW